jgi:multiple sugar transport system permease protein
MARQTTMKSNRHGIKGFMGEKLLLLQSEHVVGYVWLTPAFVFLVVMVGYPLIYNLILSFLDVTSATLLKPSKQFIGLKNYILVMKDPIFTRVVKNSFIFTLGCIFFQFTIGFALALLFNLEFPLAGAFRGLLLVTLMVPTVVVSVIFKWLLSGDFGLINELLIGLHLLKKGVAWLAEPRTALAGVMLANIWIGISFNTMLLAPGLAAISPSLYEAATIDGAGPVKRFRYITLPLLRPTIMIVLLLGFIYTFRIFGLIYAMTGGGPVNATNVLPIQAYKLSFSFFNFGQGAAANVMLLGILLTVIAVYLSFVSGEELMEE